MLIYVILIIVAVWFIVKHFHIENTTREDSANKVKTKEENEVFKISEEEVFKRQADFEEHLEETYLPDAIHRLHIYIYKNLMKDWYSKLASESRYNDEKIQKIRRDWLDYMESLEDNATYRFLFSELEQEEYLKDKQNFIETAKLKDKESGKNYDEKSIIAWKKFHAIEDAFASAIGEDAQKELIHARELSWHDVDENGNLAPEGFEFAFGGKLEPKKE